MQISDSNPDRLAKHEKERNSMKMERTICATMLVALIALAGCDSRAPTEATAENETTALREAMQTAADKLSQVNPADIPEMDAAFLHGGTNQNVRMAPSFPREASLVGKYTATLETLSNVNGESAYRKTWSIYLDKPTIEIIPASQERFHQNVLLAIHDKPAIVFKDADGNFLREYAIYDVTTFISNGNEFQKWMLLSFYNYEAAISQAIILEDIGADLIGVSVNNPMGGHHIVVYERSSL